jgi:hypothetical protein
LISICRSKSNQRTRRACGPCREEEEEEAKNKSDQQMNTIKERKKEKKKGKSTLSFCRRLS